MRTTHARMPGWVMQPNSSDHQQSPRLTHFLPSDEDLEYFDSVKVLWLSLPSAIFFGIAVAPYALKIANEFGVPLAVHRFAFFDSGLSLKYLCMLLPLAIYFSSSASRYIRSFESRDFTVRVLLAFNVFASNLLILAVALAGVLAVVIPILAFLIFKL